MKKLIPFTAILLGLAGPLKADVITNTASANLASDVETTVSLGKFNSSLGTLTAVYIEFTTELYDAYYAFDNDSTTTKRYPAVTLSMDILSFFSAARLDGSGISSDGSDLGMYDMFSLALQKNDGDTVGQFDTGGLDYGVMTPDSSAVAAGNVDSSVFSDYIGTGTFDISILANFVDILTQPSDVFADANNAESSGRFSVQVLYEYQAIPEPATMGLISLSGILGLVACRFRRRNS
jgi:hypothetical protein